MVASDHVVAAAWMGKLKTARAGGRAVARAAAAVDARRRLDLLGQRRHDDDRRRAHDRERHRLRRHRGARRAQRAGAPRDGCRAARPPDGSLERLVGRAGWTIGVAESLTGRAGRGVARRRCRAPRRTCAAVSSRTRPTSSSAVLGVDADLLEPRTAPVDPAVARQMAEGVRALASTASADVGLSTTGVAGPDPQDGQPVGTVHIAVATPTAARMRVARARRDRATRSAPRRVAPRSRLALARRGTEIGPAAGTTVFRLGYIR